MKTIQTNEINFQINFWIYTLTLTFLVLLLILGGKN